MKTYITFLLALLTTSIVVAQNKEKKPVAVKDSLKTAVRDSLKVQTKHSLKGAAKDSLKKEAKDIKLNEVVIKAKRPLLQVEIDKTVVNVSAMISNATSNTLELLEKTPGVTVDLNGGISLNGKGGVMVLIDGRQTYMSGADLAGYLKSLPGSSLDKIELIDNPSSKYDAAGSAIINLKLKKDRTAGMIGSVATGYNQGKLGRSNHSLNLNYNRKRLNIFTNLGYSSSKSYTFDNNDRNFFSEAGQPTGKVLLFNDQRNNYKGLNTSLGLDYSISPATTFGLQFNLSQNNQTGRLDYDSKSLDALSNLDSIGIGRTLSDDRRTNVGANINVSHIIGKTGRELSFDASYLTYNGEGNQDTNNEFQYILPSDSRIYTLKGDYVHPFKHKGRLEAGFKSSVVDNNNVASYYTILGSERQLDNSRSNDFNYRENINAVYLNAQKTWKSLGVQLGLRMENTNSKGKQLGNAAVMGSEFSKNYTQLFPGVSLLYKLDTTNTNSLALSISRRVNRPNYQLLNPFLFFRDKFSYTTGNPLLNTQCQFRYELKYSYKQKLRLAASYNHFIDVILPTTTVIDDVFIIKQDNIGEGYMFIFSTGLTLKPADWWTLYSDVHLKNIGLKGKTDQSIIDFNTYIATLSLNNQFSFKAGWSAETSGYYESRDYNGQTFTSGRYRVNAGVQKKIWKDKASIRLNLDDIFHSWVNHNGSVGLANAQYFQSIRSDTQRIGLGFSYRFGSDTFARKSKHRDNALDEEKGRMQ